MRVSLFFLFFSCRSDEFFFLSFHPVVFLLLSGQVGALRAKEEVEEEYQCQMKVEKTLMISFSILSERKTTSPNSRSISNDERDDLLRMIIILEQ